MRSGAWYEIVMKTGVFRTSASKSRFTQVRKNDEMSCFHHNFVQNTAKMHVGDTISLNFVTFSYHAESASGQAQGRSLDSHI